MRLISVLKVKLAVAALVGVVVVGGATAAFAATSAGQSVIHSITGQSSQAAHAEATHDANNHKNNNHQNNNQNNGSNNNCPGLPEAQQLATKFSLSTDSKSDDIQAICSLHQGTFKGTTAGGTSVSSKRVFGYGEIEQLLTYAQFLASHDKANAGSKLTGDNARSYLSQAVQSCGTTPLDTCLRTNIPGFQPGNGNDNASGSHGTNGSGNGKPSSTPTPPPHH
jgi:hypothetical protein